MEKLLEFTRIIALTRELVKESFNRRLPDSEVAAIQCMWEAIDYAEFSENHERFMCKYRECYKSTTKPKAIPTLTSGASRILKLFTTHYDIAPLTRTNFRRKITEACELGVIKLEDSSSTQTTGEVQQFVGRDRELNLLRQSIKTKNIISIWGNPGIGKSTLVRYFCEHHLLSNSHLYAKYSDFNSLESLLSFLYSNYLNEQIDSDNIIPYFINFLSERDFQLIVDFDYEIDPNFARFLESISHQSMTENSCIICISRKNSLPSYNIDEKSTLSYKLGALAKTTDYYPYLSALKLKDKDLWENIVAAYDGNFRELSYVAKFIREIFGGSISTYFSLGSLVVSPGVKDYFSSIQFSEVDYEIFHLFKEENTCMSINFFKFLKGNISTSQIFNRILFLENHGFLLSKDEDGQKKFSLSPLLRAYLIEEGRIASLPA